MRKTVISLLAIFGTIGIYAQELHTHSNAASINNEANSFTGWAGNATESSTSLESFSGSYSLKLEAPSNGWYYSSYTFPTTANEEYLITFYAKSASNEDPRVYWSGGTENTAILITNSNWTQYSHTIIATGSSININAYSGTPAVTGNAIYIDHVSITLVGADIQAPTAPTLSSSGQTDTTASLSWGGATDNVGVTEYKVYRDNALIATLGNVNTYQMTGLTAATTYSFAVRALDAAGNQSLASNLSVTTDVSSGGGDTQAPTAPTNLLSSLNTDTTADLSWNAATDNVGVTNYKIFKDGSLEATLNNVSSYQVTGLTASTAYNFTVTALDAANNESVTSNIVSVTTNANSGGGSGSSVWTESLSSISYTDGKVGIGTQNPSGKLHIEDNSTLGGKWQPDQSYLTVSNGTDHLLIDNNEIYGFQTLHIGSKSGDIVKFRTVSELGSTDHVVIKANGRVGIGTITPDSELTVKGNIHAEEVKVDLSVPGPDYVFKEGYDLKPLEEVQEYIQAHGHLPNIPSAKEMEINGIQLGRMNMKLLEKIEELTLYLIELGKENQLLQETIRIRTSELGKWKEKLVWQEARINRLEKLLIQK